MKRPLITLAIVASTLASFGFQKKETEVVIYTDKTGTVTKIEGVKPSQISVDKLGIAIQVPEGTGRVTVKTPKENTAHDPDFMKLAEDLMKKDPYALKFVIYSDGYQAMVMGAEGKPATKLGEDGGAGTNISFEGKAPSLTTVVSPKVEKIRIMLLSADGMHRFEKLLAKMKSDK